MSDMNQQPLPVEVLGLEPDLAGPVREAAEAACAALDVGEHLAGVQIWADDLDGQDQAWFRFQSTGGEASDRVLLLFCAAGSFCRLADPGRHGLPPRQIWEQSTFPLHDPAPPPGKFAPEQASRFLHHNLLLALDLTTGSIVPGAIPAGLVEAFQALWAVTVDGRLAGRGLPHFDLATRRSRFSRLFSAAGVLLPDHWQLFQSLWEGGMSTQKDVLGVCRLLPRL